MDEELELDLSNDELVVKFVMDEAYEAAVIAGCTCQPDITITVTAVCDHGNPQSVRAECYHDEDCGIMLRQLARWN